jgi:hypothetical protein
MKGVKCYWNCGEGLGGPDHILETMWNSRAFYADENQTVNTLFHNNEWNNTGICVSAGNGGNGNAGRFILRDSTVVICGLILEVDGSSQNVAGHLIDNVHIDMQKGRCNYYRSLQAAGDNYGPVVIAQVKPGTDHHEFANIVSFGGGDDKTLVLQLDEANDQLGLRIAEGERIIFTTKTDHNRFVAQTTIAQRTDDRNYKTMDTATSLGITGDVANTFHAAYGEPLVKAMGGNFVTLRDSYLTAAQLQAGRLARLHHVEGGTEANDRTPILIVERCMGFLAGQMTPEGFWNLLTSVKSGVDTQGVHERVFYKFRDCYQVGDQNLETPKTFSNY